MNLNKVSSGNQVPNDINVIIEISSNSEPIKYEVNKQLGVLFVDRFISTTMFYPCNYGYINNTLSLDGDPLDVLVYTQYSILPGSVIRCRPIGLLNMTDESGKDIKIIAVPHKKISQDYNNINSIDDLSILLKNKIVHFFKHYKDLEDGKWVKINKWENVDVAKKEILLSISRMNKK
ncbi:inorganic diphosphatase [Enterobacteriaceae endosymbiont of Plateumaris consimilis]|uniref:inorganic diphosphatase n=1 Tax=Enterobacteriaceae endosymbiont of Plateumaris consimilis TaxID=2675794 RepID=UPI00144A20EA|nr:inorganic diphosphatase [Enterobacteriaceae endosymbiont of Plateumaris consimilis]QJC28837.1 inorganic diphosphatase [Enterobacteriaceae endosymbiont of Plateumaris consimilis]